MFVKNFTDKNHFQGRIVIFNLSNFMDRNNSFLSIIWQLEKIIKKASWHSY